MEPRSPPDMSVVGLKIKTISNDRDHSTSMSTVKPNEVLAKVSARLCKAFVRDLNIV